MYILTFGLSLSIIQARIRDNDISMTYQNVESNQGKELIVATNINSRNIIFKLFSAFQYVYSLVSKVINDKLIAILKISVSFLYIYPTRICNVGSHSCSLPLDSRYLFLLLTFFFIFKRFLNLFMRDTDRERLAETEAEREAGSMQGARCGT